MPAIDEDALIKSRPLTVEERPFKRLTKRCAALPFLPPSAPGSTSTSTSTTTTSTPGADPEFFAKFNEDIELDFGYFELTIARIQLLQETNKREIVRYEQEKRKIETESHQARLEMSHLRQTLHSAHLTKQNKLHYDHIATELLSHRHLRPARDEQLLNLARLHAEIDELLQERTNYGQVWQARREQFGEIVAQLEKMQEQIQEDKEEHDRREGMDEEEGEEGEEIEHVAGGAPAGSSVGLAVGGPRTGSGAATPAMSVAMGSAVQTPTPRREPGKEVLMTESASGGGGGDGNGNGNGADSRGEVEGVPLLDSDAGIKMKVEVEEGVDRMDTT